MYYSGELLVKDNAFKLYANKFIVGRHEIYFVFSGLDDSGPFIIEGKLLKRKKDYLQSEIKLIYSQYMSCDKVSVCISHIEEKQQKLKICGTWFQGECWKFSGQLDCINLLQEKNCQEMGVKKKNRKLERGESNISDYPTLSSEPFIYYSLEKKCEVCIDILVDSLIYFESVFSDMDAVSEITDLWIHNIYDALNEIEEVIEENSKTQSIWGSLLECLKVEAYILEEILDDIPNPEFALQSLVNNYEENEGVTKLLGSITDKIRKKSEPVRNAGYNLYHVMLGVE